MAFEQIPRGCICTLQFERHWSRSGACPNIPPALLITLLGSCVTPRIASLVILHPGRCECGGMPLYYNGINLVSAPCWAGHWRYQNQLRHGWVSRSSESSQGHRSSHNIALAVDFICVIWLPSSTQVQSLVWKHFSVYSPLATCLQILQVHIWKELGGRSPRTYQVILLDWALTSSF